MSKLNTKLPQEGTANGGESLSVQGCSQQLSPDCPTVSGGDKFRLNGSNGKGVGTQAPLPVNATGRRDNQKMVQQVFHPGLFMSRPRSASLGSGSNLSLETVHTQDLDMTSCADSNSANRPTWQRIPTVRNSKRKKISSPSPERIIVSNQFGALPVDQKEDTTNEEIPTSKKDIKPPAIILYGIEDLTKLTELLKSTVNEADFRYKIINKNQLRIICANVQAHKDIIDLVRKNGLIGHTFKRKDQRTCRIVIKNLHHTTPISIIKEALEDTGNIVIGEIINARYGPEKKPTSTFFANLEQGPNNKAAKDIKYIHHQVVKIEDPRKRTTIVQCQRCQQYGHSKNYCTRPFRCLKCAQPHRTADCAKKDRNTPAKCALCFGAHPANFKGCEVYREILARKSKPNKNRENFTRSTAARFQPLENPPEEVAFSRDSTQKTYRDALKENINTTAVVSDVQPNKTIEQMLKTQAEKFDLILQQMCTLVGLITTLVSKMAK